MSKSKQIIKLSTLKEGFAAPTYFERTGNWRTRVIDCTREELIDLAFSNINDMEVVDGLLERVKEHVEESLGYHAELQHESLHRRG